MRTFRIIVLVAVLSFVERVPAIDCTKAITAPELAICSNLELKALDNYLTQAYVNVRNSISTDLFEDIKIGQREWIKSRDANCGGNVSCLKSETYLRTAKLNGFLQAYRELMLGVSGTGFPMLSLETNMLSSKEVYVEASRSIVVVVAFDEEKASISQGSGVVIRGETVATNCHVLQEATSAVVFYRGEPYEAIAVNGSEAMDYCILSVPGLPASPARLATLTSVIPGQKVYSVGSPQGLELTIAEGLVSGLRKQDGVPLALIQTSAAISPGSSGGGLFDEYGRVIGITTFQLRDSQNINFALPIELSEWLSH